MYAKIESYTRQKEVFTQSEWVKLIGVARAPNSYQIQEKTLNDIYNFEIISNTFNWDTIKILSVREISVLGSKILIKYEFEDKPILVKALKNNHQIRSVKRLNLIKLRKTLTPLNESKKKHLKAMLTKGFMPIQHRQFYENITSF